MGDLVLLRPPPPVDELLTAAEWLTGCCRWRLASELLKEVKRLEDTGEASEAQGDRLTRSAETLLACLRG